MSVNITQEENKTTVSVQASLPPGDAGNFKAVIRKGENHPEDSTVSFELSCATWIIPFGDAKEFFENLLTEISGSNNT